VNEALKNLDCGCTGREAERARRIAQSQEKIAQLKSKIQFLEQAVNCENPCTNPPAAVRVALSYLKQRLIDLENGEPESIHMSHARLFMKAKAKLWGSSPIKPSAVSRGSLSNSISPFASSSASSGSFGSDVVILLEIADQAAENHVMSHADA